MTNALKTDYQDLDRKIFQRKKILLGKLQELHRIERTLSSARSLYDLYSQGSQPINKLSTFVSHELAALDILSNLPPEFSKLFLPEATPFSLKQKSKKNTKIVNKIRSEIELMKKRNEFQQVLSGTLYSCKLPMEYYMNIHGSESSIELNEPPIVGELQTHELIQMLQSILGAHPFDKKKLDKLQVILGMFGNPSSHDVTQTNVDAECGAKKVRDVLYSYVKLCGGRMLDPQSELPGEKVFNVPRFPVGNFDSIDEMIISCLYYLYLIQADEYLNLMICSGAQTVLNLISELIDWYQQVLILYDEVTSRFTGLEKKAYRIVKVHSISSMSTYLRLDEHKVRHLLMVTLGLKPLSKDPSCRRKSHYFLCDEILGKWIQIMDYMKKHKSSNTIRKFESRGKKNLRTSSMDLLMTEKEQVVV